MNKPFNDHTFVVVDVETTGTSRFDRICEIGMTRIAGGEVADKLETIIDPDLSITNTIYHGIEDWMVEDAPSFRDIAGKVTDFIDDVVLVAHNAPFDMRFLRYELQRLDTDLSHNALCTLKIARKLHPDFPYHRLEYLLERYSITNACPHRAGSDADSEARLFLAMKRNLRKKGLETLQSLKSWGLPYHHIWCEAVRIRHVENGRMLTRDDL